MLLKHIVYTCSKEHPWEERWVERREIVVLQLYSCSVRELGLDLRYLACCFSILTNNPHCFFEIFLGYVVFQQANLLFTMHLCWVLVLNIIFFHYWAALAPWSPWHFIADHIELWRKLGLICTTFAPWCFAFQDVMPGWALVFYWLLRWFPGGLKLNICWLNLLKYLKEGKNKWNWNPIIIIKIVLKIEQ